MQKPRIALDMDEVIADVQPKFEALFEEAFGWRPDPEQYRGGKIYDLPGTQKLREALHLKGFFADLPVMPDSQAVVRELMADFDIYIVTAAMEFRASFEDKYDWLAQHFPFIHWKNIIFCGDKSVIRAEYMIDDHVRNLRTFQGKGLLYTASHNLGEEAFTRVNNWVEVRAFFEEERRRLA
jgi:5'(3')-deoxyribonucleotidase